MMVAGLLLASQQAGAINLLQAFDLAVQSDPKFAQATAARQSAEENIPSAVSRLLPTISFVGTADNVNNDNKTGFTFSGGKRPDAYWSMALNLRMNQPIYHHDYWVKLSEADSMVAEAEAEYQAQAQDLIMRTVKAYAGVLVQKDVLEFTIAEKEAIARKQEEAKQRFEVGLVAITDVHEAQAAFDQATANVIMAENGLDNAKEALREIIGDTVDQLTPMTEEIPLVSPDPTDIAQWTERAIHGNFSVIAARNSVDIARKEVAVQQAGHYPTLDLVASHSVADSSRDYNVNAGRTDFSGNPLPATWQKLGPRYEQDSVGLQLVVPFYQGGAVTSRTRQARHELEKYQARLDEMLRAADRSAKDSYRGVVSSISQVKALKAVVHSSQSALNAAEAGLEVGTRTMVDVLNEQRNLYKAKQDYSKARYDYLINGFLLKQAASLLSREDIEQANTWMR